MPINWAEKIGTREREARERLAPLRMPIARPKVQPQPYKRLIRPIVWQNDRYGMNLLSGARTPEETFGRQPMVSDAQTAPFDVSSLRRREEKPPLVEFPFKKGKWITVPEAKGERSGIEFALDVLIGRKTKENPQGLNMVQYAQQFPESEFAIAVIPIIATLGVAGYEGIRSLRAITPEIKDAVLKRTLNTGLDKWIAKRSRGIPPEKFKNAQNFLFNWLVKDKVWLQERATENMLSRMGRGANASQAAKQAVDETIRQAEQRFTDLMPKGTQTGAMAFGGKPTPTGGTPIVPPTGGVTPEVTKLKALGWSDARIAELDAGERASIIRRGQRFGETDIEKAAQEVTAPVTEGVVVGKGLTDFINRVKGGVTPEVTAKGAVTPTTGAERVAGEVTQLKELGWSDSRIAELDAGERASIIRNKITPEAAKEVTQPTVQPVVPEGVRFPPIVQAMFDASQESLAQLRNEISNVKYGRVEGETGFINFDFRGETLEVPITGRNVDLVLGTSEEADKGIALRAFIDEKANTKVIAPTTQEVTPPVTEPQDAGAKPPSQPPPIEPHGEQPMPEPTPPSGRPRTLADMNREAKGMRALSPDARAAVMDVAKPIKEDELLYKVKPFKEHANNLLQPDTPIKKALRAVPGVKQAVGVWNPAQMERDNPIAMIGVRKAIFEEIETGRARLATLNWWHDAEELFQFKKVKGKWRATNIQLSKSAEPTKPYHATIHDLVEHPENYVLTAEQESTLHIAQDMQRQILRDAQRVGVDAVELTGDYWRRIVTKTPKDKLFGGKVKSGISQRKGYTRQRAFDFVDDGAKMGFEYETHPLTALQNRLEAGIRTISDQNARQEIAKLPGVEKPLERLESRYPQTVEGIKIARQARDAAKLAFLRDKTVENHTALRQAEADYITSMREVYIKKIEASQPSIGELKLPNGRIAPSELVEEVRKWIDLPEITTSRGQLSGALLEVTRLFRSTLTNFDLAAGFIQGQALFYRNNIAWWRGQANAIVSLIDDPTAYVAKNFDIMDEGMRMGAISIPTEFLFTKGGLASIPTRIPVVGPVMKSLNRSFEWFILTGQTELYRAARGGTIKRAMGNTEQGAQMEQKAIDALTSLGSAIRKELGTESYAILGIRPTQHTIEQLTLFAARFFRALTGFQAQAFTGGEGGREARSGMGSLIAGGLSLLIAVSWLKDRKMPNLTDPFEGDWMQVKIGNTYFNPFGPFYPYFRTQARVSFLLAQGKPKEAAIQMKWFLQSKAGLPLRGIDMAAQFAMFGSYRTFEGESLPATPLGIGKGILGEFATPILAQEAMQAIPEGRPESVIGEVVGLVGRKVRPYSAKDFEEYYEIPSDPDELKAAVRDKTIKYKSRDDYKEKNPEVDAKLFISGQVSTIKTPRAYNEVLRLVAENKIKPTEISAVREWVEDEKKRRKLGVKTPTPITDTQKITRRLILKLLEAATAPPSQPAQPTVPYKSLIRPFKIGVNNGN